MSIQVRIPHSLTYKMKLLSLYSSLFSFLRVMHKISFLISDSCEAYIWLDYTKEQKSQRKEKQKTHTIYRVPRFDPSVCVVKLWYVEAKFISCLYGYLSLMYTVSKDVVTPLSSLYMNRI